jgi:hypothetical protein
MSRNPFRPERRAPLPTDHPLGRPDRRVSGGPGLPYETEAGAPHAETGVASLTIAQPSLPPVPALSAQSSGRFGTGSEWGQSITTHVKFSLAPSPVKSNVHLANPGLRQFFEAASPTSPQNSSQQEPSKASPPVAPASAHTSEIEVEMEIDEESGPAEPLRTPGEYLEEIARSEKRYTEHLDTIAPYIRSAFKEWQLQDQGSPLSAFLVHYFGRPPSALELQAIEQLMVMRTELSSDQDKLRDLHAKAVQDEADLKRAQADQAEDSRVPSEAGISAAPTPDGSSSHKQDLAMTRDGASSSRILPGEAYERLACVGEGTYGKVYKARRTEDGTFVALKRIRMEGEKDGFPVTAMREIKLLQAIKQENIIRLHEMMVSKGMSLSLHVRKELHSDIVRICLHGI